ncbi:glutaminase A [Pseudalkalibacillus caeni]|uniref:Glutaminase n=1 Tax=Exobacillus caeni TaxID=2574798 RepID=A0A5R9FBQ0_9BACL|nr:glutaminase A [Pseudalkalibacillus caeni]TLS37974.1 glutaminase A [Pseudalkalibacillus caeni]
MVSRAKPLANEGKVADYIPGLANANPEALSIAIFQEDEKCLSAGDVEEKFTLQSISKIITLALAIMDAGEEKVFSRVGMEPTGDPFNSIAKLESMVPSKPLNPMINAGALVVTSLISGETVDEKVGRILTLVHDMTNNPTIGISHEIARSEYETSHLNRALSHFMKQHGVIEGDVEQNLETYTKQCSIEVDCKDLARIGMVLAKGGKDPDTGREIIPSYIARIVKTFMVTCGMYNASGEFAIKVAIPAKSGVSGGILSLVPNEMGIGVFSPPLDQKGNSIAGVKLLEILSSHFKLSIF